MVPREQILQNCFNGDEKWKIIDWISVVNENLQVVLKILISLFLFGNLLIQIYMLDSLLNVCMLTEVVWYSEDFIYVNIFIIIIYGNIVKLQ